MLDLKITGGQLIDGTGAPARRGDVGVTGDAITAVGDLAREPAGRTIDASGRTVTPGACRSSTMIVMMMAITPSLKASSRPLLMFGFETPRRHHTKPR